MRTGKQVSKHYQIIYKYAPIWTFKILKGLRGYSIERAYDIDPVFGQLVERGVRLLQIEDETLAALARTSTVFGAFAALIEATQYWAAQLDKAIKMYENGKLAIEELDEYYEQYNYWFYDLILFKDKTLIPGFAAKVTEMFEQHDKYQTTVAHYDTQAFEDLPDEVLQALAEEQEYWEQNNIGAGDDWIDWTEYGGFN